jgi:hypothetical protein
MRIRICFSCSEISHIVGSRLRPNAWARATAVPIIPPLLNGDVLGLPETFRISAITVDVPGDKNVSECKASCAWIQR